MSLLKLNQPHKPKEIRFSGMIKCVLSPSGNNPVNKKCILVKCCIHSYSSQNRI